MHESNNKTFQERDAKTSGNMTQAIVMLATGIIAALFGIYGFLLAVHTEKSAMVILATVTGYEEYTEGRPKGRAIFEYTVDGTTYTGYGQTVEHQEYTIGRKIQVLVDRHDPGNAIPVSDNNRRMSDPVLILTVSGAFLFAGLAKIREGKEST